VELLCSNGINVSLACNGQEALDILAKKDFDGVLMDCQMPVMDGYTATRYIRKQERFKELPILAMTANAMLGDKEKVIAAGMNDHIAKPINIDEMFSIMASWITPSNPAQESINSEFEDKTTEIKFPDLNGIDTKAGLAVCQNNYKLYRKLLIKFRDNESDFHERFEQARVIEYNEAATRCVHSLKGVAGNIGASEVQNSAQALELACQNNRPEEQIIHLLEEVLSSLSIVLTSLEVLEQKDNQELAQDIPLDKVKLKSLLSQLRELLEEDDADAADIVEEIEELPGIASQTIILKHLLKAIDSYDFELALDELGKLELL